jgi:transcriptional regulator with XRE-family HTH domain
MHFELLIALELGRRGVAHGPAFKFMRKSLRFSAKKISVLLGVWPETVSRWENQRVAIPIVMFVVLATLVRDMLSGRTDTRDQLEALQGGAPLPREVKIAIPVQID